MLAPQTLLKHLLHRCLPLFSQPVEKRAGILLQPLLALGLTVNEAARCFERCPMATAVQVGYCGAIDALSELLEEGSVSDTPGGRLLADLLISQVSVGGWSGGIDGQQAAACAAPPGLSNAETSSSLPASSSPLLQPAAAALLTLEPGELRRRADSLMALGLSVQVSQAGWWGCADCIATDAVMAAGTELVCSSGEAGALPRWQPAPLTSAQAAPTPPGRSWWPP